MWNEDKKQRLDALRIREAQGTLTSEERAELESLFAELDADEATALAPALERMRQQQTALRVEREQLKVEVAALERIAEEQEQLLAEANAYLSGLRAKRSALADEYRRVSGHELSVSR